MTDIRNHYPYYMKKILTLAVLVMIMTGCSKTTNEIEAVRSLCTELNVDYDCPETELTAEELTIRDMDAMIVHALFEGRKGISYSLAWRDMREQNVMYFRQKVLEHRISLCGLAMACGRFEDGVPMKTEYLDQMDSHLDSVLCSYVREFSFAYGVCPEDEEAAFLLEKCRDDIAYGKEIKLRLRKLRLQSEG